MNNKGADQTARMRKLICAFVVRIWQNRFSQNVAPLISIILDKLSSCFFFIAYLVEETYGNDPKFSDG